MKGPCILCKLHPGSFLSLDQAVWTGTGFLKQSNRGQPVLAPQRLFGLVRSPSFVGPGRDWINNAVTIPRSS